jgi:hypothetical protein
MKLGPKLACARCPRGALSGFGRPGAAEAHALGGDRSESNRYQRGHVPRFWPLNYGHTQAHARLPKGDGTRLGPPFEDVALVRVRKPVGKPAHLDRPALLVDFDRQQPVDAILRPPT